MKIMHKINDLSDYPAIKKLASALHKFDASQHGAAIMIGAGFSRSAARHVSGEKKMSLWSDFSKKLVAELNPDDSDLSFSDPLRVAEEYRAYFGQAALNDRIRSEIDDEAWRTGDLYQKLLELPWAEIMTTNWDTLLERAAKDVHSPYYTPVTKPSDLAWAPSPRIVKLHGTIGVTETFIAAQEDYRTYPAKSAPFVNFARQVFIENELCLLGFSGDDPNFLQWAGWVRDHLTGHARKIYLVGALNLTAARRKHLESINVAPIDLWDMVKHIDDRDRRHQAATELFLQTMWDEEKSKEKPYEWTPKNLHRPQVSSEDYTRQFKEPEYAASLLKGQLETLKKDRESYPGWLVCPHSLRWHVQSQLNDPFPNSKNIAALESDDRANLLYEIAWRYGITFESIPSWLAKELFHIANPDEPCSISKRQQLEICLILLKNSRWLVADNAEDRLTIQEHVEVLLSILKNHAFYLPDCSAELAYHQALVARDALDYADMEVKTKEIVGEDSVWKLRQAALLMELGRFDDGTQLIAKAYGELRENYRRDRYSIPILSRLMWAHWLLDATHRGIFGQTQDALPNFAENIYRKWKCDPWTWVEHIQEKVRDRQEDYFKNQSPVKPLFEQGYYQDNSKNHSNEKNIAELFFLDGLTRCVGIPLRSGRAFMNVSLLAGTAEKLVLSGGCGVDLWDYTLAIRAASSDSSPSIKDIFTRIAVASAPSEVINTLVERILIALDYWCEQRRKGSEEQQGHALSVLRKLMEVLARLVIRQEPEKAKEIFRLAISLGKQEDFQHIWLAEAIQHLLTHSLKSIPESKQGELLADALEFPLQSEVMDRDFPRWPNPVIAHPNTRETYHPSIDIRIGQLIEAAMQIGSVSGTASLLRLLPLTEREDFLTLTERAKLVNALWGSQPDYRVLPNADVYPHAWLLLPAPDKNQVEQLVRCYLYEHSEDVLNNTQKELRQYPSPEINKAVQIYSGMANAAANEKTRLFPTREQALTLFDRLTTWRPWENGNDSSGFDDDARKPLTESIGNALSYAIAPALSVDDKTAERLEQLQMFYSEVDGSITSLPAFVYFVHLSEQAAISIENLIRKALQGRNAREVSYAALALQKWMESSKAGGSLPLNRLISRLIVIIDSGRTAGLQQLILVAVELLKKQRIPEDQLLTLTEAVSNAFNSADYHNIEPSSREAISASSIREACVKLASVLSKQYTCSPDLQDLLERSKTDSLPEVRFAIS